MPELRGEPRDGVSRPNGRERGQKFRYSKRRQRRAAAQGENFGHTFIIAGDSTLATPRPKPYPARRRRSVVEDLREELLRALGARLAEEIRLGCILDDP